MSPELVTFGETMVILDPAQKGPLRYVNQFNKRYGGAESNVAIGVSRLGHSAGWISKLGDDEFGTYLLNAIRGEGVDVSGVTRAPDAPTGVYFKERVREGSNQVYYYRSGSAASEMNPSDIDWDYIKEAGILHVSGITPFLSESCLALTQQIMTFANEHGIPIAFDPNLRLKIISKCDNHKEILLSFIRQSSLFMPGIDEAEYLFGTSEPDEILTVCQEMGVEQTVLKNGAHGTYFADGDERGFVESHKIDRIADPIGAGDGFAAGVLSARLEGLSLKEAVERGSAIGAMIITVEGDIEGLPTKREIDEFLQRKQDVTR